MTYVPFQEPQSGDPRVITRQVWTELRRIETAFRQSGGDSGLEARVEALEAQVAALDGRVSTNEANITVLDGRVSTNEANITALDGRVSTNEADIAALQAAVTFLYDGTHAFGYQSTRYRWTPPNSPTAAARISFDTVELLSNVTSPDAYSFSPQYEGDFTIFVRLNFEADSSGDEWRIQGFDNGVGIGPVFEFKPDEIGGGVYAQFFFQTASHFHVGDVVDLRLWPKDSGKRGYIEDFTYQMVGLGIEVP